MKIKFQIKEPPKYNLQISQAVDGKIFIMDHPDIDIVIIPDQNKIITFPKDEMEEQVYGSQDIFFKYLSKRGIVSPESVQGGNVHFSIEGTLPISKNNINIVDLALANIAQFLEEEKGYFQAEEDYKESIRQKKHSPDEDESTRLGKVKHATHKGAIPRGGRPFSYGNGMALHY